MEEVVEVGVGGVERESAELREERVVVEFGGRLGRVRELRQIGADSLRRDF